MKNVLDLRQPVEVEIDYSTPDFSWLAAYALAFILLIAGLLYAHWLDSGCVLNGIMTWSGKVCIN